MASVVNDYEGILREGLLFNEAGYFSVKPRTRRAFDWDAEEGDAAVVVVLLEYGAQISYLTVNVTEVVVLPGYEQYMDLSIRALQIRTDGRFEGVDDVAASHCMSYDAVERNTVTKGPLNCL
jgi:hypothetical protein